MVARRRRPHDPRVSSSSGRQIYATHCVACHGEGGRGDGPSAAGFATKPSDLTDGRLMNRLPDEFLVNIILHGGAAEGLSPNMPPFAGYLGEAQARDVIAHLRSLAQPPFTAGSAPRPGDGARGAAPADLLQPPDPRRLVSDRLPVLPRRRPALGVRRAALGGALHGLPQDHRSAGQPGDRQDPRLRRRGEPIPWVRVFKVPEFTHFPHKPHIRAEVACQTCHGPIERMRVVGAQTGPRLLNDLAILVGLRQPPPPLSMGWCVDCHRQQNATRGTQAPLDCVACHH